MSSYSIQGLRMLVPFLRIIQEYTFNANGCGGAESRFDRLLKSVRTDELSMDDITREVEAVRQEQYEKGKQ